MEVEVEGGVGNRHVRIVYTQQNWLNRDDEASQEYRNNAVMTGAL